MKTFLFLFYKTSCLNEEVNRTKPSPSVRLPCSKICSIYCNQKPKKLQQSGQQYITWAEDSTLDMAAQIAAKLFFKVAKRSSLELKTRPQQPLCCPRFLSQSMMSILYKPFTFVTDGRMK